MFVRVKQSFRTGCELIVCVVARISGCPGRKELSLGDQIDHAKEVTAEYYQGPVELRIVATKGKGENLERPELAVIEQQLRSRELDLLIYEGTQFRELVEQAHRERVGTSAEQWTKRRRLR